jgi:HSP20 family protein
MANTLTRWDPFNELDDLQHRLSRLFGRAPVRRDGERDEAMTVAEWAPVVDIAEDDKNYVITAELPDVSRDNVKVTVQNGILTIHGERAFNKEEKGKKYHRVERAYGSFARSFTLPEAADPDNVSAEFKSGLLIVSVPKSEKAKPRSIDVKIG